MSELRKIYLVDNKIKNINLDEFPKKPLTGWLSAIRQTLGMSAAQLAKRLNLTRARISKIEESEEQGSLKLSTLESVAAALGCDVHYVLLPKEGSFMEMLRARAKVIATQAILSTAQHMSLEDQSANDNLNEQIELLADELLHDKLKNLWDYDV